MTSKRLIALGLMVSIGMASCSKPSPRPPPPTGPTQIATGEKTGATYPLKKCADIGAPAPTGSPYIVTLDDTFTIRDPKAGHKGHAQGAKPGNHPHPTTLDIVTQISGRQSGQIQIQLTDKSSKLLHFMDLDKALLGATVNAPDVFCDAAIGTDADGDPMLSFTFFPVGSDTSAAVNLGLLVGKQNKPQLPIIIDPWEDNNGLVSRY